MQPSRVERIHGRRNAARRTRRRFFAELPFLLVAALILTVLVKGFLIQAFFIPSRSMEPTLDVGDRVVRRAVAQGLGGTPPGSEDPIKRVVGVPGDVLEGRNGRLIRNGQKVDEPYLRPGTYTSDFVKVKVKPDHIWVMGDNREDSADSRSFGQVPQSTLVGQAVVTIWPVQHVGGL